jgi:hypothetical protein
MARSSTQIPTRLLIVPASPHQVSLHGQGHIPCCKAARIRESSRVLRPACPLSSSTWPCCIWTWLHLCDRGQATWLSSSPLPCWSSLSYLPSFSQTTPVPIMASTAILFLATWPPHTALPDDKCTASHTSMLSSYLHWQRPGQTRSHFDHVVLLNLANSNPDPKLWQHFP